MRYSKPYLDSCFGAQEWFQIDYFCLEYRPGQRNYISNFILGFPVRYRDCARYICDQNSFSSQRFLPLPIWEMR